MRIEVNIEKRHLAYLILTVAILAGINYAVAFGTNDPENLGHSVSEINFEGGFTVPSGDVIVSSGKVGIGTTSPGAELDVAGNINLDTELRIDGTSPQIRLEDTGGSTYWIYANGNRLYFLWDENLGGSWVSPYPLYFDGRDSVFGGDLTVSGSVTASSFSNDISCNWNGDKIVQSDEETEGCSPCCSGGEWCANGFCQRLRTNLLRTTCSGGEVTAMNYEIGTWGACYCTGTCTSYI